VALQSTTAIATVTLQSASSTITFSGIPNIYRDLILVGNYGATSSGAGLSQVQFNSDVGNNYHDVWMANRSDTGGPVSGVNSGVNSIRLYRNEFDANTLSHPMIMQVLDYSATDKHKTCLIRNGTVTVNTTIATAARWANSAAINSVTIFTPNTFLAGSTFSLFGRIA
jgi:hypothetical protein